MTRALAMNKRTNAHPYVCCAPRAASSSPVHRWRRGALRTSNSRASGRPLAPPSSVHSLLPPAQPSTLKLGTVRGNGAKPAPAGASWGSSVSDATESPASGGGAHAARRRRARSAAGSSAVCLSAPRSPLRAASRLSWRCSRRTHLSSGERGRRSGQCAERARLEPRRCAGGWCRASARRDDARRRWRSQQGRRRSHHDR